MKYELTEEMVMRLFERGEIPYRCARVETWIDGENYPREVGHIRLPEDIFEKVKRVIEEDEPPCPHRTAKI